MFSIKPIRIKYIDWWNKFEKWPVMAWRMAPLVIVSSFQGIKANSHFPAHSSITQAY